MGAQSTGQVGQVHKSAGHIMGAWGAMPETGGMLSQRDLLSKDWLVQPGQAISFRRMVTTTEKATGKEEQGKRASVEAAAVSRQEIMKAQTESVGREKKGQTQGTF